MVGTKAMGSGKEGWGFERDVGHDNYDVLKYTRDRRRCVI